MISQETKKQLIFVFGIGLLLAVLIFFAERKENRIEEKVEGSRTVLYYNTIPEESPEVIGVLYAGNGSEVVVSVPLVGTMTLKRSLAGSDVQYTDKDETIIFSEKDGVGQIIVQGKVAFSGIAQVSDVSEEEQNNISQEVTAHTWSWERTVMNNDDIVEPRISETFTLRFTADGNVYGTTDCNNFSGSYTLKGEAISFGAFVMTKKYCEGSQELEFGSMVSESSSVFFTEEGNLTLLLPYDSGSVIFRALEE